MDEVWSWKIFYYVEIVIGIRDMGELLPLVKNQDENDYCSQCLITNGLSCIHLSGSQHQKDASTTMHAFYIHHSSDLLLQTPRFLSLAVLVIDSTSYALNHLDHPPHTHTHTAFWLASCRDELPSSRPLPSTLPNLLTMKKCPGRKWFVIYHTLDKMRALCHHFWLQRCPRPGKFLRCTWWLGMESPDEWKTSEKVRFLLIFPKLRQYSQ